MACPKSEPHILICNVKAAKLKRQILKRTKHAAKIERHNFFYKKIYFLRVGGCQTSILCYALHMADALKTGVKKLMLKVHIKKKLSGRVFF